ncbi:response regulator [Glaciecola sp. 2405UD65-10]|uniref:response regulator n=1 Tax=Glaciecola sp. 2405UD65-10 TaxID=3397244 RepID=UPI003B5B82BE
MKILIVDDSPIDLSIINETISKIGEVTKSFACTPIDAIDMAIKIKPDLIILDVIMSGMDGVEVAGKLARSSVTADIPILFITADVCDKTEVSCYQVGCIDFLTKPINMHRLVEIITQQSFVNSMNELIKSNREFAVNLITRPSVNDPILTA